MHAYMYAFCVGIGPYMRWLVHSTTHMVGRGGSVLASFSVILIDVAATFPLSYSSSLQSTNPRGVAHHQFKIVLFRELHQVPPCNMHKAACIVIQVTLIASRNVSQTLLKNEAHMHRNSHPLRLSYSTVFMHQ